MTGRKRVAVLVSGRGSNMEALMAAAAGAGFPAEIVGVVSDRPEARGLAAARERGVAAVAVPRRDFADRAGHEAALSSALADIAPDIVCLAGYMRVLSGDFVARWSGRLLNVHPSLLPAFPGLDTHRRALEAGVRIHGASVHFVTGALDSGPVVAQAAVPVLPGDGEEELARRVLAAEHRIYPLALALVARGDARMEGSTVRFYPRIHADPGAALLVPSPELAGSTADLEHLARFTP